MQTFADLLSARRDIRNDVGTSGNLRFGNKPKLAIPGERPLTLPSEFSGLVTVLQPGSSSSDLEPSLRPAARITLLYEPTFVAPLKPPTAEELTRLGHDPSGFRNENARCACLAVQFRGPDGETIYGVGRLVALENGIRMGKTAVLAIEDLWSADFDVVISSIVELLRDANESVNAGPEPQAKKWQTVVALLGGADDPTRLPVGWRRELSLVAGLYGVTLDIRPNPESARATIGDSKVRCAGLPGRAAYAQSWVSSPGQPHRCATAWVQRTTPTAHRWEPPRAASGG